VLKVSDESPISIADLPHKVQEVAKTLPHLIFIKKWHVPKGTEFNGVFVGNVGNYLILMFKTVSDAHSMAGATSCLRSYGMLVNQSALFCNSKIITKEEETNICALIQQSASGQVSLSSLKTLYVQTYGVELKCSKNLQDYITTAKIQTKLNKTNGSNGWVARMPIQPPPGFASLTNSEAAPLTADATKCVLCKLITPSTDLYYQADSSSKVCRTCFDMSGEWTDEKQNKSHKKVVALLKLMSENDDVMPPRNIVRKVLLEGHPTECASKGQANLWIEHSIQSGIVIETRHCDKKSKAKVLVLPENKFFADTRYPVGYDTSEAESVITDLLWDMGGAVDRKAANNFLKKTFPRMAHPMMRGLVMRNAASNKAFFVAKGPHGQTVGLTYDDAVKALKNFSSSEVGKSSALQGNSKLSSKHCSGRVYCKEQIIRLKDEEYCRSRPKDLPDLTAQLDSFHGDIDQMDEIVAGDVDLDMLEKLVSRG